MSPLKFTLKRGVLLAGANWQATLVQAAADSLFKLLIAVPAIGGISFVGLVVGAEPSGLLALEWREMVTTIVGALLSQPLVLLAFLAALAIALVGGSLLLFLAKGGTVAVLTEGDRRIGDSLEQAPLHLSTVRRASGFSVEAFMAASERFFPRFARLGACLMGVYLASAVLLRISVTAGRLTGRVLGDAALMTIVFVAWITVVNLYYLLTQIIIVADDCTVSSALRRTARFLREDFRRIATVFGVMMGVELLAMGVSVLAIGALGLIAFVPFFGLAALPVQLMAWLFRSVVFEFLGLTTVGAYLTLYRRDVTLVVAEAVRASAAALAGPGAGQAPGPASSVSRTEGP